MMKEGISIVTLYKTDVIIVGIALRKVNFREYLDAYSSSRKKGKRHRPLEYEKRFTEDTAAEQYSKELYDTFFAPQFETASL